MSAAVPISIPSDLLEEINQTAAVTHLSKQDVMRQSMKAGLSAVREKFSSKGRITNVDPLPDQVLHRIYSNPERDDEPAIRKFIAAQAFGGDE